MRIKKIATSVPTIFVGIMVGELRPNSKEKRRVDGIVKAIRKFIKNALIKTPINLTEVFIHK